MGLAVCVWHRLALSYHRYDSPRAQITRPRKKSRSSRKRTASASGIIPAQSWLWRLRNPASRQRPEENSKAFHTPGKHVLHHRTASEVPHHFTRLTPRLQQQVIQPPVPPQTQPTITPRQKKILLPPEAARFGEIRTEKKREVGSFFSIREIHTGVLPGKGLFHWTAGAVPNSE